MHIADQTVLFDQDVGDLRWFLLPSEALMWLQKPQQAAALGARKPPFQTATYPRKETVEMNRAAEGQDQIQGNNAEVRISEEKPEMPVFQDGMVEYLLHGYEKSETLLQNSASCTESRAAGRQDSEAARTTKSTEPLKGKAENLQMKTGDESCCEESDNKGDSADYITKPADEESVCDVVETPLDAVATYTKLTAVMPCLKNSNNDANTGTFNQDVTACTSALNKPEVSCNKDMQSQDSGFACARRPQGIQTPVTTPHTGYKWQSPPKEIFKPTVQVFFKQPVVLVLYQHPSYFIEFEK